jgi:hypothetical protein
MGRQRLRRKGRTASDHHRREVVQTREEEMTDTADTADTTVADQEAELARQAHVVEEVARAAEEELPGLGADNGVPVGNEPEVEEPEAEAEADDTAEPKVTKYEAGTLTTAALPGVVTEAKGKGKAG